MNNYFGVSVVLLYMFIMFFCIGGIINMAFEIRMNLGKRLVYGGVAYFLMFSFIYIIVRFTTQKLMTLAIVWWCMSLLVAVGYIMLSVRYHRTAPHSRRRAAFSYTDTDKRALIGMGIIVGLAILEVVYAMVITKSTSTLDSSYYNGIINGYVHTGRFIYADPYTGIQVTDSSLFKIRPYESYCAVLSAMFHIHPLIIINRVMGIFEILVNIGIVFLTIKLFIKDNIEIAFVLMLVFVFNIAMSTNTIYTREAFLFYRLAEPKSVSANITLPLLWFVVGWLHFAPAKRSIWLLLILTVIMGMLINDSALFLVPVSLVVLLCPLIIHHWRHRVVCLYSALSFVPCAVGIALYFIT